MTLDRFSTFFGHVPWLGILVARLPGLGSLLHALMAFAYKRTDERLRRGSKSRDIFYYIVRARWTCVQSTLA